jgi:hypothetical protein
MILPKPLSLHPLVRKIKPELGETTSATLDFFAQEQEQINWCWAAVATSVGLFYGTGNWTQCDIVTEQTNSILDPEGNHDCCDTPILSTCNQYGYLNVALQQVQAFQQFTSGKPSADLIFSRLSERREVVCVRVNWFGGTTTHFTTVNGITDPSSGGDIYLTVSDTLSEWGTTTILYSEFPQQYKSGGSWTDTYWTKNILGPNRDYGRGVKNSVALDNNANCVSLHVLSRQIASQFGRVDFLTQNIDWGPSVAYGVGDSIAIDVDDIGRCVGVHTDSGRLHYRVGAINTRVSRIDWGTSIDYGSGDYNEIALSVLGVCLSIHVEKERLYYRMGMLKDDQTISWMQQAEYGMGLQNSIALTKNFNCVEVHVGTGSEAGRIFYRVGRLNVLACEISWGANIEFDTGVNVSIALDNNLNCRTAIVDNTNGKNRLIHRLGIVDYDNKSIKWAPRIEYGLGDHNSLSLDDSGKSVEVHVTGDRLFSKTSW